MADKTYTVTVASGNLYGGGTGNVFYLDGARNSTGPGTVSWVADATLRFDQSDATNDNHPLIFSTNTSTSGIISSGVTYYLDGSSNQTNYTNTTTFNAATTRYVEITPSSQTDFFYLCYIHGIGMGGIFDVTSKTWGALTWNLGAWGNQADVNVDATGISLTSAVGGTIAQGELQVGWGGDTWGENEWGDLSGAQPTITGQQLTSSIGSSSVTANANVSPTGIQLTSSQGTTVGGTSVLITNPGPVTMSIGVGSVTIGIGAATTGLQMTSSVGSTTIDESILTGEGWGRAAWGEFAWGVNYSVALTGQSLTSSIGDETASTDVTVSVTGQSLTSTQGSFSLVGDFGIVVFAAEDQLDFTIGSLQFTGDANVSVTTAGTLTGSVGTTVAGLKTPVDVTGISMTMSQGSTSLVQTTTEAVTGQQLTSTLGTHAEIPGQIIGVQGLALTSSIGSVTVEGTAGIDVTGIQMSASVGNVAITPWQEVDLGVNNVWTEVDLAA
tara:strand:- start:1252 stop:2742 length:1491 start_codon:yes stop_codon:yes gene_type:complete